MIVTSFKMVASSIDSLIEAHKKIREENCYHDAWFQNVHREAQYAMMYNTVACYIGRQAYHTSYIRDRLKPGESIVVTKDYEHARHIFSGQRVDANLVLTVEDVLRGRRRRPEEYRTVFVDHASSVLHDHHLKYHVYDRLVRGYETLFVLLG